MVNSVSVVIPIYNEIENLTLLHERVTASLERLGKPYELILVDDGSRDGSTKKLHELADRDDRVKVIEFRRNYGQTAAMYAGMQYAGGDVVVTMDGDLQNDPDDIPMMLEKIEEGFDLVHGWRKNRQDSFLDRKLPSKVANWLISRVTDFPVHDLGCTLKAIRREFAHELRLYGEMHRFIPILAHWQGARCAEVVTTHHPRRFGQSKYGIGRVTRVLLDLITVKYLIQYLVSPMKLFGNVGLLCFAGAAISGFATIAMWFGGIDMTGNPLLLLTVFSAMLGVQFLGLGMLGELSSRIYFEVQDRQPYQVRHLRNFDDASSSASTSVREPAPGEFRRAA